MKATPTMRIHPSLRVERQNNRQRGTEYRGSKRPAQGGLTASQPKAIEIAVTDSKIGLVEGKNEVAECKNEVAEGKIEVAEGKNEVTNSKNGATATRSGLGGERCSSAKTT